MQTYIKQGFSFVRIIFIDLVLPLVEGFLFDKLKIVHLMKEVCQKVFRKSFEFSVDLHGVNCFDLLLQIRIQVFVEQILIEIDR